MSKTRRAVAIQTLMLSLSAAPIAVYAQATYHFDLPAQPMANALLAVGSQARATVTFEPTTVQGRRAKPVKGNYTARQAVDQLLKGSDLEMVTTVNGSFVIKPGSANKSHADHPPPAESASSKTYSFHLSRLPLADALAAIEKNTGQPIQADTRLIDKKHASAINGQLTASQAIQAVLIGTGLIVETTSTGAITIRPPLPDSVHALEKVNVTARIESLAAMRVPTELREIPQSVSVISQETLQQQNAFQLSDALNWATGITLTENYSLGLTVQARGFAVNELHIDGGPPINPAGATTEDLSEYDRVELLRGADALFGGHGNPGATISLQRKQPLAAPEINLNFSAGSWNQYRTMLDATDALGFDGALRGRIVMSNTVRDYFYDRGHLQQHKIYGTTAYDLSPQTTLTVGGSLEKAAARNRNSSLPLYESGADPHLPRSTSLAYSGTVSHFNTSEVFTNLQQHFGDRWALKINANLMHTSNGDISAAVSSALNPITNRMGSDPTLISFASSSLNMLLDSTLSGSFDWHGRPQDVLIGMDYSRLNGVSSLKIAPLLGPSMLSPWSFDPSAYQIIPATPLTPQWGDDSSIYYKHIGAYVSVKLRPLDDLSIVLGARDNYLDDQSHSIDFLDTSNKGVARGSGEQTDNLSTGVIVPYAAVVYDLSKQYSLYVSYATIYQPGTSLMTWDRNLIGPAQGVNEEAGIKAAWYQGRLNGSFALYRIHQTNQPMLDPNHSAPGENGCCFLAGTHASKGFETELSGRLAIGWTMSAGYTFNVNRAFINLTDIQGLSPRVGQPNSTQTPRHMLKLWTNYQFQGAWSRWNIGGGVIAQTANYSIGFACTALDASGKCIGTMAPFSAIQGFYTVATLRAGYRISPSWSAALNVNNLFDRTYYQTIGTPTGGNWYGEPRNAMLTVTGSF